MSYGPLEQIVGRSAIPIRGAEHGRSETALSFGLNYP